MTQPDFEASPRGALILLYIPFDIFTLMHDVLRALSLLYTTFYLHSVSLVEVVRHPDKQSLNVRQHYHELVFGHHRVARTRAVLDVSPRRLYHFYMYQVFCVIVIIFTSVAQSDATPLQTINRDM